MNQLRMYRMVGIAAVCFAALPAGALAAGGPILRCPRDSVKAGDVCVDTYEASVWQIPSANNGVFLAELGGPGAGDGQFSQAIGVAVDAQGNVFVSDFNIRVQKFACP